MQICHAGLLLVLCWASEFGFSQGTTGSQASLIPLSKIPTNIYVTDRDTIFKSSEGPVTFVENVNDALKAVESRPADLDPEGNWGQPVAACQLSLRFARTNYHVGEMIQGRILLRNLGTNIMRYTSEGFPITWTRTDDGKGLAQEFQDEGGFASSIGPDVFPHSQREFDIRVDELIGTNAPATFRLSVRTRVPKRDKPGMADISSANATINILPEGPKNSQEK